MSIGIQEMDTLLVDVLPLMYEFEPDLDEYTTSIEGKPQKKKTTA